MAAGGGDRVKAETEERKDERSTFWKSQNPNGFGEL
jgi:hypothetical protein